MREGKTRLVAFLGTVALHVAVVAWLTASPERAERLLDALEMDLVELREEPDPGPEPLPPPPEPEVEPAPAPEPDPAPRRERREPPPEPEEAPPEEEETPPVDEAPAEPGPEGPVDEAPGPRVLDFGDESFATSGSGATWGMRASRGTSVNAPYRPGVRGGGGGGGGGDGVASRQGEFQPVPQSGLSRLARLESRLARRYPEEARRLEVEGTVRLLVDVRSNGTVASVRVLSDPGGGLGDSAVAELRDARFSAALDREGRPVDTRVVYTVRYVLEA